MRELPKRTPRSADLIKSEIIYLIQEAAQQGVFIESIEPEFIGTMGGDARITYVNFRERRR